MRASGMLLAVLAALMLIGACTADGNKGRGSSSATAAAAISGSGNGGAGSPSILEQISTHELAESLGGNAGLAILNSHFLVNLAGYLSFMTNSVVNSPAVGAGSSAAATAAAAGRRMLQLKNTPPKGDGAAEDLVRSLGGTPEELATFLAKLETNLNALYGL